MTMPSSVSAVRKRLARSARAAQSCAASSDVRAAAERRRVAHCVGDRLRRRRRVGDARARDRATIMAVADLDHAMRVRGDFLRRA